MDYDVGGNAVYAMEHEGNLEGAAECCERRSAAIACMVALTLVFSEYWLLNYSAFPLFDTVFIWTRELSACVGGAFLAAVALAAFWRPRPLSGGCSCGAFALPWSLARRFVSRASRRVLPPLRLLALPWLRWEVALPTYALA